MARDEKPSNRNPRRGAERDAAQPAAGQPRKNHGDPLMRSETVPSRTDREMKKRDPGADRHANASFEGSKGEPTINDENPPRGNRGGPKPES